MTLKQVLLLFTNIYIVSSTVQESFTTNQIVPDVISKAPSNILTEVSVPTMLESVFAEYDIVPDVVTKAPQDIISVNYQSGVEANLGNELTPTQVKDVPQVSWNAEEDQFYTLVLTDPDAPSRLNPMFRESRHWLVVNILGANVSSGETLTEYIGSGPPLGTGLHRYVFLVYKQPGKLEFDEEYVPNTSTSTRRNFSIADFAKKYNLGNPVAGNFYQAQYDEYVPVLHKQVGIVKI